MTRYLIVGNSAGGVGAAEAIRELDRQGPLTIVSEEPCPAYSRPLIARYLAGETEPARMLYRAPDHYERLGAEVILGHALAAIDLPHHQVHLEGGHTLGWDRLLLAVGGVPIVPDAAGLQEHDHFTFTTLGDAQRLAAHLASGRRQAVVVGGGLIGLSVSEALVKRGLGVSIVELAPQILGRALDAHAASLARRAVEAAGVRVLTGRTIAAVNGAAGERAVRSVVLDDGAELECDTLVIAIGVRPRVEVAAACGLAVNRGIVVDRHMATSHPHVYACGDVAESYDFVASANRVTPVWPNAYLGGRIAGRNMAGEETVYSGGTAMNSLHSFGLSIMSAGLVDPPAGDGCQVLEHSDPNQGTYRRIVVQNGRVAGMVFAGDSDRAGVVFGLMRSGVPVTLFQDRLLDGSLGLLSLPRELRERMIRDS